MGEKNKVRHIKPGELQNVQASEEVTRRNVQMILEYTDETRKMLLENLNMFDTLQNNFMNLKGEVAELRRQLSFLQQKTASGGTKDYGDQR